MAVIRRCVAVIVIAPVIAAALVNGNDTVGVIDTVDNRGADGADRASGWMHHVTCTRSAPLPTLVASPFAASITPTVSFPLTSAATITDAITITGGITITATAYTDHGHAWS